MELQAPVSNLSQLLQGQDIGNQRIEKLVLSLAISFKCVTAFFKIQKIYTGEHSCIRLKKCETNSDCRQDKMF